MTSNALMQSASLQALESISPFWFRSFKIRKSTKEHGNLVHIFIFRVINRIDHTKEECAQIFHTAFSCEAASSSTLLTYM